MVWALTSGIRAGQSEEIKQIRLSLGLTIETELGCIFGSYCFQDRPFLLSKSDDFLNKKTSFDLRLREGMNTDNNELPKA